MRWLLSRLGRAPETLPRTCYVMMHAPESLSEVCDCDNVFCKWPPNGNTPDSIASPVVVHQDRPPDFAQQPVLACFHYKEEKWEASAKEAKAVATQDKRRTP